MSLNKIHLFISSEIALPTAGKDVLINTGYKYAIGSYNESDGCFWFDGDCWCKGNVEWADIEHIIDAVKDINENIENGEIVEKQNDDYALWILEEGDYDIYEGVTPDKYICSKCGCIEYRKSRLCPNCGRPMKEGKEHEQLAEWLTELKKLRQLQNSINKAANLCEKCSDTSECPMFYPYLKEGDSDAES